MFDYKEVINFWYDELDPSQWWKKDMEVDKEIERRFLGHLNAALKCELYYWRQTPLGRLAEIIVIDQFSRNLYRDSIEGFVGDPLALALAQEAVSLGVNKELNMAQKTFLYMPYMHSESLAIHDVSVELHSEEGLEVRLHWEHKHRDIIVKFDRYPHRNEILGRESTAEELTFLNQPGSSF